MVNDSKKEEDQPGCMRGIFHFFHFHHLLFTGGCRSPATSTSLPEPELQPYHVSRCKGMNFSGVEAPRNSLELQEFQTAIPEDYYGVPISIEIAQPPAMSKKNKESPVVTPRTRSIVARLMGLDVSEDVDSSSPTLVTHTRLKEGYADLPLGPSAGPNFYAKKQKKIKAKKKLQSLHECKSDTSAPRRPLRNLNSNFSGSVSLPDSPRPSSERPRHTQPGFSLDQENKPGERKYLRKNGSVSKPVKKVQKPRVKTLKMEPGKCSKTRYERFTRKSPQPTDFKEESRLQIGDPEFNYVKAILARAEVSMKRVSISLPIDPTIFHVLEFRIEEETAASLGALQHRWNRKLLFHLVEEILGDLLLCDPNRLRRWSNGHEQLLYRIWSQIRSLPRPAVCQVVGDIDSLVARDLPVAKFRRLLRHPLLVAEAREIATEIELDILNSILGEAAESLRLICSGELKRIKAISLR